MIQTIFELHNLIEIGSATDQQPKVQQLKEWFIEASQNHWQ